MLGDPIAFNLDSGKYYPPGAKLRAAMKTNARASAVKAAAPSAQPIVLPPESPAPAAQTRDPFYDWLDEEVSAGSGVKVKHVAFGVAGFLLLALAMKGR